MILNDFFKRRALWMCVLAVSAEWVWAPLAVGSPTRAGTAANGPAHLVESIQQDASQINMLARQWAMLTLDADSPWRSYYEQWSLIKPVEEDIGLKLTELNKKPGDLTPSQRKGAALGLLMYGRIQAATDELGELLATPGIVRNNPGFRDLAMSLARQAKLLSRTV